jgi:hypothetical protein
MTMCETKTRLSETATLRVHQTISGFEVHRGEETLGYSNNEPMAIWSAVTAAEEIASFGYTVRVINQRGGHEIEEFVAWPPRRGSK